MKRMFMTVAAIAAIVFGFAAPAGAAGSFVIPDDGYPTMRGDGTYIVDVPASSEVYWHVRGSGEPGIVYQGQSFELAPGTTILDARLQIDAVFAEGVDTDVEFYRPVDDPGTDPDPEPDPDLIERPGKGNGGPPKGICGGKANESAGERVPGWLCES